MMICDCQPACYLHEDQLYFSGLLVRLPLAAISQTEYCHPVHIGSIESTALANCATWLFLTSKRTAVELRFASHSFSSMISGIPPVAAGASCVGNRPAAISFLIFGHCVTM